MSEKFKLSVGGSTLKVEKIEERTDSIGRKMGLRSTDKDSTLIKKSISMKKRWKDPEFRKKQKEIFQSEEYKNKQRKVQTRTREEWIEKFKSVHGDRYDYRKFEIKGRRVRSYFICKLHGRFSQTPEMHLKGRGCPICGRIEGLKNRRIKHGY